MFVDVEHPTAEATQLTGAHIKLTATPSCIRSSSPLLGPLHREIFGGPLVLAAENIDALQRERVTLQGRTIP